MVVVLAVTSAFSTAGSAENGLQTITPHEQSPDSQNCVVKTQPCSFVNNGIRCRVGQLATNPVLWNMEDGECVIPLYKP